ncbi:phosphotyrosine protein phosphatase [Croceitalea sp. P059]|uniref:phosphotyrosine protein phosphatase n=1 Tax=Croceitalea sp. P059 TaxID=3075601 RepID=UPI00288378BC|nr:phosphotyrosine protein phosphatase [Croceitalea sp. P059]MDT0539757.1 phosphotyrosine protein phosphatase [Croceitalea sp. P059]
MKNILFVCSANKDRSKTAEDYFSKHYPDLSFDSAGTNKKTCNTLGTTYITREQLDLADDIFVMENKHLKAIKELFGGKYYTKTTVLNIKDIYTYGSQDLIEVLKAKILCKIT